MRRRRKSERDDDDEEVEKLFKKERKRATDKEDSGVMCFQTPLILMIFIGLTCKQASKQ